MLGALVAIFCTLTIFISMLDDRTKAIIEIFQKSWTETKDWYERIFDTNFEDVRPFVEFIVEMIKTGEDRFFRAGRFMDGFSISRSVNNRLRDDQKFILVEYKVNGLFKVSLREGEKIYRIYRVPALNDKRFIKLLATLKHTLVD